MALPVELAGLKHSLRPVSDRGETLDVTARQSAVLVLLYPRPDGVHFVLTKRPDTLSRHAGQISLPGGVQEAGDRSLWDTAVRETCEEIGLRPGRLQPLGRLDPYHLRVSRYVIHPFVAWNPVRPMFRPQAEEVAELIEVPMGALLDAEAVLEETWELRGQSWRVTFYRFSNRDVWGATAHILAELARNLQGDLDRPAPHPGSVHPLPREL